MPVSLPWGSLRGLGFRCGRRKHANRAALREPVPPRDGDHVPRRKPLDDLNKVMRFAARFYLRFISLAIANEGDHGRSGVVGDGSDGYS